MAKRQEIFGLIPRPRKTAQLKRMYANMERYLAINVYSITPINYNEREANMRLSQTEMQVRLFTSTVMDWFSITIEPTYRLARRKMANKIERKFKKEKVNSINHQKIIDAQLKRIKNTIIPANKSMITQAEKYIDLVALANKELNDAKLQEFGNEIRFKEDIRNIIRDGQLINNTRQEVTRDISNYFTRRFGAVDFMEVGGRSYQPRYYAELLARTEMRKAQTEATINANKEYENDLVIFSIHFHARPDYEAVDPCAPLEEQVFSISGESDKYPQLDESNTPPIHPMCMHNLDAWDEILGAA